MILDSSVFICYSTPNYSRLTTICLESLKNVGVTHIEHLIDNPEANLMNKTGFQSDLWYWCVRNKIEHLITVIKKGELLKEFKYFIFSDCDIVYIKENVDEWKNVEEYVIKEKKDIYFMRENVTNDVNSGFFIIKNNENIEKTLQFFTEVLEKIDASKKSDMPFGDQSIINNLKSKLNYGYIPNEYVIFGTTIYNKKKSLLHHAICCRDVGDKINQINHIRSRFVG